MAKNYSLAIWSAVENFFTENDWNYEPREDSGLFRTGVSLKGKLKSVKMYLDVKREGLSILSVLPFGAEENNKAEVAEYITRANYGLVHGNFEMDFSDGELRYKTSLYCGANETPTFEQIKEMVYVNIAMIERYGDGLMKVLFGMASPKDAIDEIENS